MTTSYQKGANFERLLKNKVIPKILAKAGIKRYYIMRSSGSKGLADLLVCFSYGHMNRYYIGIQAGKHTPAVRKRNRIKAMKNHGLILFHVFRYNRKVLFEPDLSAFIKMITSA